MALWAEVEAGAPDPRWWAVEETLLHMRSLWFDARISPFHCGRLVTEPDGELIGLIAGTPEEADQLVAEAARRRAYIIVTPFSRPEDLTQRLRSAGYHMISRQGTYIYDPDAAVAPEPDTVLRTRRLLAWLRRPVQVRVRVIGQDEIAAWNRICYEAFGPRGQSEADSLVEKRRAFMVMGDRARWYMAMVGDEPAGCAILYQGVGVAQVLAVGTLTRFRGRGVATTMVRQAIRDWSASGENGFLFLDTRPGSQAERIYMRMGFAKAYLRSVYSP